MKAQFIGASLVSFSLLACGGSSLDVGSNKGDGGNATGGSDGSTSGQMNATGGTNGSGTSAPPRNALVPQTCSTPFDEVWEGDSLDFSFKPQNKKWRITLQGTDTDGQICGTATYIGGG